MSKIYWAIATETSVAPHAETLETPAPSSSSSSNSNTPPLYILRLLFSYSHGAAIDRILTAVCHLAAAAPADGPPRGPDELPDLLPASIPRAQSLAAVLCRIPNAAECTLTLCGASPARVLEVCSTLDPASVFKSDKTQQFPNLHYMLLLFGNQRLAFFSFL